VTLQTTDTVEIGWHATQARPCTTNCVQTTDVTSATKDSMATALGASRKYTPVAGKVSIKYKNVSTEPVTIEVYRIERVCDAEACAFLTAREQGRWLVFKIEEFTALTTSQDGSYSIISGITANGKPFSFRAVWWTDDRNAIGVNCAPFVKRYLDNHTPKEQYRPYVISGQAVGDPAHLVLKAIDTCAPKAPNFGVPDQNVFK
jgi:hypothetical protein